MVLGPDEWLKYQCGESHTLSVNPDSSDLFTATLVIAHATPLGGCFVTITYGKQVEYQCEAGYHVGSGRKSGSKPEGCHAKERAEPEQLVQAPEEPVGCGVKLWTRRSA